MILKKITLHNIRSYTHEEIYFPNGRVLLCGDIGSGKSSILIGIEFSLFGLKRGELNGDTLLRKGKKDGYVELEFEIENKEIIIRRNLKKSAKSIKQESGSISIDGNKTECTPVELRAITLDILGYPKDIVSKSKDLVFRYTVYTPQEDMKQILNTNKEDRLNILRRVFNIDKYKRIRDNLTIINKDIREQLKLWEGQIINLSNKDRERADLLLKIKNIVDQAKELSPKLQESIKQIQILKKEIEALEIIESNYMDIKKNVTLKSEQINNIKQQIKLIQNELNVAIKENEKSQAKINKILTKISKPEDVVGKVKDIEYQIENDEKEFNEKLNFNNITKEKIKSLKEKIIIYKTETASKKNSQKLILEKKQELKNLETVMKHKPDLESNSEKISKIMDKIKSIKVEHEYKINELTNSSKAIKELSSCPTCKQEVSPDHKHSITKENKTQIKTLTEELNKLKIKESDFQDRITKNKENIVRILEKEKEYEKIKFEIIHLEKEFADFDKKKLILDNYEKELIELKTKIIDIEILKTKKKIIFENKKILTELRKDYDLVKEYYFLIESLNNKNQKIIEYNNFLSQQNDKLKAQIVEKNILDENIVKLNYDETKLKISRLKLVEFEEVSKQLEINKMEIIKDQNMLVERKSTIEKEIEAMLGIKNKIQKYSELKLWLTDYFSNITTVIEKHVMQKVHAEFNELFKEGFSLLLEDEIISARLDEEFTPIIEQNGFEVSFDNLSGGEKTSCSLAYRLALNKVINDCIDGIKTKNLIILDEPTDGFSNEQLDKVRELLDYINIPQIILVSHENKIESFVENIVRITKDNHSSKALF